MKIVITFICLFIVSCKSSHVAESSVDDCSLRSIKITDMIGQWHLSEGYDTKVPIDKIHEDLPRTIVMEAEKVWPEDLIESWCIGPKDFFDVGDSNITVDDDGDYLGEKGLISGGSVFFSFLFTKEGGIMVMKVYTLVRDGDESERIHVATYNK